MKSGNKFISVRTAAYSGATLLAFLLGSHPQIATVAEMNGLRPEDDPETYKCSCGQLIKACDFWKDLAKAMEERGFAFDVASNFNTRIRPTGPDLIRRLHNGSLGSNSLDSVRDAFFYAWPPENKRLRFLVSQCEALIDSVLNVAGAEAFVDTSKGRLHFRSLRQLSNLDIYVIHLVRDVRGIVASRMRRNPKQDVKSLASDWVKLHSKVERDLLTVPEERRLRVRYEDLCGDVGNTLDRIYHFCGVDPELAITEFWKSSHHLIGNPMRLRNLSEIKLDERWKTMLLEEHLQEIDQIAGDMRQRYNYELNGHG